MLIERRFGRRVTSEKSGGIILGESSWIVVDDIKINE